MEVWYFSEYAVFPVKNTSTEIPEEIFVGKNLVGTGYMTSHSIHNSGNMTHQNHHVMVIGVIQEVQRLKTQRSDLVLLAW